MYEIPTYLGEKQVDYFALILLQYRSNVLIIYIVSLPNVILYTPNIEPGESSDPR